MKFFMIKLLILSLLLLGIYSRSGRSQLKSLSQSKTKAHTHMKTTYWVRPLIKTSKFYHSFANLAYCPGDVINQLACPLCDSILDNSFEVFKFYKHEHSGYIFTFVLLYSTNRNELVIALSGPRSPHPAFYSTIYSRGWDKLQGDIKVEKTYLDIYGGKFKAKLSKAILKYNERFHVNPQDHKYIFVGHSFGGSLAILSAFDMVKEKIIPNVPELDSPLVYSYGSLRIGDCNFVDEANKMFKIVRVVKSGDFYPRMPSCSWAPSINKFRCEREFDYNDVASNPRPELLNYIQNYYGRKGGLSSGLDAAYANSGNPNVSFLERNSQVGWSYSANNPGYTVNNLGNPFDEIGRNSDEGKITYSQPLGAEVLFSNNFKRHTICSYYYGIPNCEKAMSPEFGKDSGKDYFNSDLTDC